MSFAPPERSIERAASPERLKNGRSASTTRASARKKNRENHSRNDGQQPIRRLRGWKWFSLVFFFSSLASSSTSENQHHPLPGAASFSRKRLRETEQSWSARARQLGGQILLQPFFFSMACGKLSPSKKESKSRSQILPSPALLARRVETVAVLVMRCAEAVEREHKAQR